MSHTPTDGSAPPGEGAIVLETPDLELVSPTLELLVAEMDGRLAEALGAVVPSDWPPEQLDGVDVLFHFALSSDPGAGPWFGWYWVRRATPDEPATLVGLGGFKGRPRRGVAEIGYAVLPAWRRRGFATQGARALTRWACAQPDVHAVIAHVAPDNAPSIRVLERAGLVHVARDGEELRYRRDASRDASMG